LSTMRAEHGWTDSEGDGKWFLSPKGIIEVERRLKKAQEEADAFINDTADEDHISVAA